MPRYAPGDVKHRIKREEKQRRFARLSSLRPEDHGTYSTYTNWGCRDDCPATGYTCQDAARDYRRAYRESKKAERESGA